MLYDLSKLIIKEMQNNGNADLEFIQWLISFSRARLSSPLEELSYENLKRYTHIIGAADMFCKEPEVRETARDMASKLFSEIRVPNYTAA